MEIYRIDQGSEEALTRALEVLQKGGVILYPTDTLYGLGADAFSDEAVKRVHVIKGRDARQPIACVVADMDMAARYVEVNDTARKLAGKFLPGGLTMVLKKKPDLESGIARGMETIGIRIPDNQFCLELARRFGKPYTATSANLTGLDPDDSVSKILEQFGDFAEYIDLSIDAGVLPKSLPSTVVNLVSGHPTILREGVVPALHIMQ